MDIRTLDLKNINFSSLRIIARKLGVESPTKKKKGELIEAIKKAVEMGDNEEIKNKTRKGRPCLQTLDLPKITNFTPINLTKMAILDYSEKFNEIVDEYVEKVKKLTYKYLKELEKLSEEK